MGSSNLTREVGMMEIQGRVAVQIQKPSGWKFRNS
jgi:hypothetical protein